MSVSRRIPMVAVVVAVLVALTACASGGGADTPTPSGDGTAVIAPVTMSANDLQGATVDLVVGQSLNILTGDLAGDSYTATVSEERVAEFVPGGTKGDAEFNPGVRALAVGEATVVLANADGGIQDVTFTVDVTAG